MKLKSYLKKVARFLGWLIMPDPSSLVVIEGYSRTRYGDEVVERQLFKSEIVGERFANAKFSRMRIRKEFLTEMKYYLGKMEKVPYFMKVQQHFRDSNNTDVAISEYWIVATKGGFKTAFNTKGLVSPIEFPNLSGKALRITRDAYIDAAENYNRYFLENSHVENVEIENT